MCGRFALHNFYANRVADEYPDIPPRRWDDEEEFHPRYNVAPQTNVPVIMQQPNGQGQQEMIVQTMRWGLQAKWSDSSSFKNPINARSEVVLEGTANIWNSVRGSKHCIVVCEGYYEWLKKGTKKLPHYVKRPDGHLLLLAGFYEIVKPTDPPGKTIYTCTILTTEANEQLAFLHERMPVILNGEQAIKWMDVEKGWMPEVLEELRRPYKGQLVCYEVPDGVGKVGNEDPLFVEPLTERKDGLRAMMSRMAQKPKKEEPDSPPKRKREPTQVLSDDSDIEADKPSPSKVPKQESPSKVTKQEPSPKSEPEEVVLDDDSDVEEVKPEPKSSLSKSSPVKKRRGGGRRPKRGSSPIEIDLTSGSDNDIQVDTGPKRIKVEESKPSPRRNEKKRPTKSTRPPDKKTIIDFFGKK